MSGALNLIRSGIVEAGYISQNIVDPKQINTVDQKILVFQI